MSFADQSIFLELDVQLATNSACIGQAKTDVVIFKNGDRLTGEVKSLERGRLRFKTDATDTINIEWDEVAYLSSDQNIQVETVLGKRYLGQLVPSEEKFNLVIATNAEPVKLNNTQVVQMTPIEEKGVNRIDGEITAGYNFTKASEVTQLNLGVELGVQDGNPDLEPGSGYRVERQRDKRAESTREPSSRLQALVEKPVAGRRRCHAVAQRGIQHRLFVFRRRHERDFYSRLAVQKCGKVLRN